MDDNMSLDLPVPDNILQPLLVASDTTTLNEALERLIDIAKTCDGRLDLTSKCIILPVLQLFAKTCDGRLDLASKCITLPVFKLCHALLIPSATHKLVCGIN